MTIEARKNDRTKKVKGAGDVMWVTSLGINLVLSSIVGLFVGFYIDKWLHTKPIFMFLFFVIGVIAGFRQIFKEMKKLEKNEKETLNK